MMFPFYGEDYIGDFVAISLLTYLVNSKLSNLKTKFVTIISLYYEFSDSVIF